jgi:hypothetical protein
MTMTSAKGRRSRTPVVSALPAARAAVPAAESMRGDG